MRLTDFLRDAGKPVAFYPGLKKITKSIKATLFLCQLLYWEGKQSDPDGWIYKVSSEIEEETGLTWEEQNSARKQLISGGFIEEYYRRLDHTLAFKLNLESIDRAWEEANNQNSPISQNPIGETVKTQFGNQSKPNSLNSNTENTTENTTEKEAPSIFKSYQREIGLLTPMISDQLKDAENEYPGEWIEKAMKEAVNNNKRNWNYVHAILKRWKIEGVGPNGHKAQPGTPAVKKKYIEHWVEVDGEKQLQLETVVVR